MKAARPRSYRTPTPKARLVIPRLHQHYTLQLYIEDFDRLNGLIPVKIITTKGDKNEQEG